jgi:hypothetical protein
MCCHHHSAALSGFNHRDCTFCNLCANEDGNDDVAPPSQHSASESGTAESSSDSCQMNQHSSLPKIESAILFEIVIISKLSISSHPAFNKLYSQIAAVWNAALRIIRHRTSWSFLMLKPQGLAGAEQ